MKQPKDRKIQLRLSAEELEAIDALAKVAGKNRTEFLVAAALNQEVKIVYADTEPVRKALRQWSGIASNINQIAHRMNMRKQRPEPELQAAMSGAWKASMEVKDLLREILRKLDERDGGRHDNG